MNMNDILKNYETLKKAKGTKDIKNVDIDVFEIMKYFLEVGKPAEKLVSDTIGEEKYCAIRNMLKLSIMTLSVAEGNVDLVLAEDSLSGFADSFFFAMLGILIDEEVV